MSDDLVSNLRDAYAFNGDNVQSAAGIHLLNGPVSRGGRAQIVAIGVSRYGNSQFDLRYAAADAHVIDTTGQPIPAVVRQVLDLIQSRLTAA